MSSLQFFGQDRLGGFRHRANALSFSALFALTVASAFTGAAVALVVQRYVQRYQRIDVLPAPTPIRHLQEQSQASVTTESTITAPAVSTAGSMLAAVSANLTAGRTTELEQLVAENDDVVAGDGSVECPIGFPIKGAGRSGIYHAPGGLNYNQTRPTVCFRSTEAADRAGFRPAQR